MLIPELETLVDLVVEEVREMLLLVLVMIHQLHQLRDILDQEIGMLLLAVVEVLEDLTLDILDHLVVDHFQVMGDRKIKFRVV